MFKKLKKVFKGFSKKVETSVEKAPAAKEEVIPQEDIQQQIEEDKVAAELPKVKEPIAKVQIKHIEEAKEKEETPVIPKEVIAPKPETKKPGFFTGVTKFISEVKLTPESFDKLFGNLEIELLQNNIAMPIVEEIKEHLQLQLTNTSLKRKEIGDIIEKELHNYILQILNQAKPQGLGKLAHEIKPLKILFVGVNGVGKTTSMAKVCKWFQNKNLSCVFAAGDTFRAASIEQLQEHATKLDVKMIKHEYGSDAAAVAFDAIKHAEAKGVDVVLIDTAGRTHANADLMAELEKIKRVAKPDLTLLVVDALTGNDAVEQAKQFNDKVGIDGSILTKVDADEKGGALISVAYTTGKPIYFLGVGQEYKDFEAFDPEKIINKII